MKSLTKSKKQKLAAVGDAREVDDGFLHRHFDALTLASELALTDGA